MSQAVVVVHSDPVTGDHLVAYVVATGGVTLDTAELTATARERLPDYMVPNLFVQLDEFPLNASGKLDRKALPAPDFASAREYREPSTPAEQAVAQIFADLLGAERVGADDDFFELGGNSLIATRAVARINSRFSVHVEVLLRPGIADPQGSTVERSLPTLGFEGIRDVRVGKSIRFTIDGADEAAARAEVEDMCRRFLSNPVIEDAVVQLEAVERTAST